MKNAYRYLSFVFAVFLLGFCFPAQSAYQYTYTTTAPFDPFSNRFEDAVEEDYRNFTADNSFKLTITSNTLLTPSLTRSSNETLELATFDFMVGNYSLRAQDTLNPDSEVVPVFVPLYTSGLFLHEVDSSGLPTKWLFNTKVITFLTDGYYQSVEYETTNFYGPATASFNVDYYWPITHPEINATSTTGVWTLNEISSPVPENETYAMMLVGLGVLCFVGRRRNHTKIFKKSNWLN